MKYKLPEMDNRWERSPMNAVEHKATSHMCSRPTAKLKHPDQTVKVMAFFDILLQFPLQNNFVC